jgi:hypothetical protein
MVKIILPLLTLVAQWVQVLSQSETVTISLVHLSPKSIEDAIDTIEEVAQDMHLSTSRQQNSMALSLFDVVKSLRKQFDLYFNNPGYKNFWFFSSSVFRSENFSFAHRRKRCNSPD